MLGFLKSLSTLTFASVLLYLATWGGNASYAEDAQYQMIEWIELIPRDDLEALMNPPDYLGQIADGSDQDTMETLDKLGETNDAAKRFRDALQSVNVVAKFNKQAIRIPGFVVPLESNEDRDVTSFFIVPYFGACLHMPPPPPNQIIFARWEEGLTVESLAEPFWFEGTLDVETNENELGTSAYSLSLANVELYQE